MTLLKTLRCDLCNTELKSNEVEAPSKFSFNKDDVAKNRFQIKIDGISSLKKDICYKCALQIRNHIEKLKTNN